MTGKVVVVGATGFIGNAVTVSLLKKGYEVYGIGRNEKILNKLSEHKEFHPIKLEFNEYGKISEFITENVDYFFYLAYQGVSGPEKKDYKIQLKNTLACCLAVEEAVKLKCRKFVYGGSSDEYEISKSSFLKDKEPSTACIYGISKWAGENIGRTIAFEAGMEFNSAYLTLTYGEGNSSNTLVNTVIRNIMEGKEPRLVKGGFYYDIIYIEEAVKALEHIALYGINMENYYVGHIELMMFEDIVTKIRDVLNPNIALRFGEYSNTNTGTNYAEIDRDKLFRDTGCVLNCKFDNTIKSTANWLMKNI